MAGWAAVIMCAVAIATIIWRDGITRGRVDALLEELTQGHLDHEDRLRELEGIGPRRPAARERAASRRPRPPTAC